MKKAILTITIMVIAAALAGCGETRQCAANCGWAMRAEAQARLQDTPDPGEDYFAEYERTFKLNEQTYYRTEWDSQPCGAGAYAWGGDDSAVAREYMQ